MKYIDAVIFEGMRKWPSVGLLDRICTKDIILNDPVSNKDVSFKVGDNVQLNVIGIQRDPKYFENPMKFDPERFYDANRQNIDPNTILSFGFGPRILERHEKSVVPLLKLDESSPKLEPKGGFVVKLCKLE
uniref:Cytochrome P450 n=1 Tax=Megaselia scalaris TaxID=36166 RepID=T1GRR7_MEGSC